MPNAPEPGPLYDPLRLYRYPFRDALVKPKYKYHDTPEGKDCVKKIWYLSKWAGATGVFCGIYDIYGISKPKGYAATLLRMGQITLPITALGAAYAVGTCIAADLRKKDDYLNLAVGALATASVFGAWHKNGMAGYAAFVVTFGFAVIDRLHYEAGIPLFTEPQKMFRDTFDRDYSISADPRPDYIKATDFHSSKYW